MLHSIYELEERSRQVRVERLREAESERLALDARRIEEPVKATARGLSSKLFNRRALKMPPLEAVEG